MGKSKLHLMFGQFTINFAEAVREYSKQIMSK